MISKEFPAVTESELTALKIKYLWVAPTVIKIIYDQSRFHLPGGRQKVKFDAVWLCRFSTLDREFILNTNEDLNRDIMFIWLGNHLFLILPEGQTRYIQFNWLLLHTFRMWKELQILQFSYSNSDPRYVLVTA